MLAVVFYNLDFNFFFLFFKLRLPAKSPPIFFLFFFVFLNFFFLIFWAHETADKKATLPAL